jgi:hypothetical protein
MGRKYIKEQNVNNFIYPNNVLAQYGVEIIHDINNNSVSGSTANFTGTSISSTGMTFQFDYTWLKNGAQPYVRDSGYISILSIHMMTPDQTYFKPWRLVGDVNSLTTTGTTYSGTTSFTVTPSQFGLSSFTNGDYYFEIRFIGEKAIYPVCRTYTVSTIVPPTPTPTPTPTVTPTNNPTPTPTPTVGVLYQSGATLNVTDTGWIKYTSRTLGPDQYVFISSLGTYTITDCVLCSSIFIGVPFADVANFTITNCGTSCGSTPAPTPTPSRSAGNNGYYIMTDCQTYQTRYSQLLPNGTYNSGDRVMGGFGYYYVITGFTPSTPDPSLIFFVTATGEFGCP